MKQEGAKPSSRLRIAFTATAIGILGLLLTILLAMNFGNPQWHKLIYIYQSMGETNHPEDSRPHDYTGVWRAWFAGGERSETTYRNGKRDGTSRYWFMDGEKASQSEWREGLLHGPELIWYKSGQMFRFRYYSKGRQEGPDVVWRPTGQLACNAIWKKGTPWSGTILTDHNEVIKTYENGKEVARRPFLAAQRRPTSETAN